MRGFLDRARVVALVALLVGAVGAVGLMFAASGPRTPRLLLVLFAGWVLSPFAALAWAYTASRRWSVLSRTALYAVTLVISLGTLAVYATAVIRPRAAQPAFPFVAVPPASWMVAAVALATAGLLSRRGGGSVPRR